MLERLSSAALLDALQAALSSATDVGGVASLLSDVAPLGLDLSSVDPFAEAMARGVAVKREVLERAGGGLTSSQVARALGITGAVPAGSGEYLYPACQFTGQGVVPRLERVLRAFPIESPWTQLSVLIEPAPALGGRTVLEALQAGDVSKALDVVAGFGEQGA
jgi:hypothetical protein